MNIQIKIEENKTPEICLVGGMDTLILPWPSINTPSSVTQRNHLSADEEKQILKWFVAHMK